MTISGMLALADADETAAFGAALAEALRAGDVIALAGELGAGKTTLARGILAGLGLREEAPSPSYSIVIAYEPPDVRIPIWHVDLYRIDRPDELEELGLEEIRDAGALLIEWPERLGSRSFDEMVKLALEPDADGGRRLTWSAPTAWERRWLPFRS